MPLVNRLEHRKLLERVEDAVKMMVAGVQLRAEIVTEREDPTDPLSPIVRQYEVEERPGVVYIRFTKASSFARWLRERGYAMRFEDAQGLWLPMHAIGVPKELANWRRRQEAAAAVAVAILRGQGEKCEIWVNTL